MVSQANVVAFNVSNVLYQCYDRYQTQTVIGMAKACANNILDRFTGKLSPTIIFINCDTGNNPVKIPPKATPGKTIVPYKVPASDKFSEKFITGRPQFDRAIVDVSVLALVAEALVSEIQDKLNDPKCKLPSCIKVAVVGSFHVTDNDGTTTLRRGRVKITPSGNSDGAGTERFMDGNPHDQCVEGALQSLRQTLNAEAGRALLQESISAESSQSHMSSSSAARLVVPLVSALVYGDLNASFLPALFAWSVGVGNVALEKFLPGTLSLIRMIIHFL